MSEILHLIQSLSRGGAARSMIATAKYSSRLGNFGHRVASLLPAEPAAMEIARGAGLLVQNAPGWETIRREMETADIVQVHFWNNPEIYQLLRSQLPAIRLLLWFHVAGDCPPQIITEDLIDYSDFALASSPYTYSLPIFQNLPTPVKLKKTGMVYGAADFARVWGIQPKAHDTFNVGYIGTVDFAKMHPNYVPMSAAINIPQVQFIVCGSGGGYRKLKQQAMQLNAAEKFDFRGYVEDIKSVIEILDVFGYPLCEDNYSTAELVLQEVMYAGVPPVIFSYGGAQESVVQNYTGLIVNSELEYSQAIEYLYHHPEERARLGRNAREYAQQNFGAENAAKQLDRIYSRLMELPKRQRNWGTAVGENRKLSGAELFIQSLGNTGTQFAASMTSENIQEQLEADRQIASSSPVLFTGGGGILSYRSYYPNDGYLRLWSGLVLQQQGRYALAVSEFTKAIALGSEGWRVSWYLAQAAEKVGASAKGGA